jgi:hypothetical protein
MSIEERLRDHLRQEAADLERRGEGPARAMKKGRSIMIRRRLLAAFGGAFVVTASIAGVLSLGSVFDDGPTTGVPGTGGDAASEQAVAVPAQGAELEWYTVPGTLGFTKKFVTGADGTIYALSTAPGQRFENGFAQPAIYTSDDAESWAFAVLDDSLSANDLAERDGTLYLIGTAPGAVDASPRLQVAASDDGGETWDVTDIPVTATPPDLPSFGTFANSWIVAGERGVLAAVHTTFVVDYAALLPEGMRGDNVGVEPTDSGVIVMDYASVDDQGNPAIIEELTWADLGIDAPGASSAGELFLVEDGGGLHRVESPVDSGPGIAGVYAVDDGFLVVENPGFDAEFARRLELGQPDQQAPGVTVWSSADGASWEAEEGLPAMDWVQAAGSHGGDTVIVGMSGGSPIVAWQQGGSWETVDLQETLFGDPKLDDPRVNLDAPNGESWISSAAIGPLGVALAVGGFDAAAQQEQIFLVVGTSPDVWTLTPDLVPRGQGFIDGLVVGETSIVGRMVQYGANRPSVNLQIVGTPVR